MIMVESIFRKIANQCRGILPGVLMIPGVLVPAVVSAIDFTAEEEDVTRVEVVDWSQWMSDAVETDPQLVGNWETETLGKIRITTTPIASNTYFVQTGDRIVPCFQIDASGRHYLLIATRATESLEIAPEVFSYTTSGDTIEMKKLSGTDSGNVFCDPDSFTRFVSESPMETLLVPVDFRRI